MVFVRSLRFGLSMMQRRFTARLENGGQIARIDLRNLDFVLVSHTKRVGQQQRKGNERQQQKKYLAG